MMPMTASEAALRNCSIFQDLTAAERRQVLELSQFETFDKGEVILREGRSIQILWVVLRGQCEVVKSTRSGGEQSLAQLEPMAVFGEMSFFNPAPHSASIRAMVDVETMLMTREAYDTLMSSAPAAAYKIAFSTMKVLAERLRKMDEWTCGLVEGSGASSEHRQEWHEFRSKLYSDWQF